MFGDLFIRRDMKKKENSTYYQLRNNTMKSLLAFLIFPVAVCQTSAEFLNITIYYSTLDYDSREFFQQQFDPTFNNSKIVSYTRVEMVPFGLSNFTEDPFNITCENGPDECRGNLMHMCFMHLQSDKIKQAKFVNCCMTDLVPHLAGKNCAKELGYSYDGVDECIKGKKGISLQKKYGKKTKKFKPKIRQIPVVVFDNVYNSNDDWRSSTQFHEIVLEKLNAKGIKIDE